MQDRLAAIVEEWGANPLGGLELELRFQHPHDPEGGAAVLEALRARFGDTRVVNTLNTISSAPPGALVRTIRFEPGARPGDQRPTTLTHKIPRLRATVPVAHGLLVTVSLADELPTGAGANVPASDDLVRCKARASWEVAVDGHTWTIDATAVVEGVVPAGAGQLPRLRAMLAAVHGDGTLDGLLALVRAPGGGVRFELELELVGRPPVLTAAHLHAAAAVVAGVVDSADPRGRHDRDRALVLGAAAALLGKPARAAKTMKSLLPSMTALTVNAFAGLFPPAGRWWFIEKTDGRRALAAVLAGVGYVLSDVVASPPPVPGLAAGDVVAEGELLGGVVHVYDVLQYDGQSAVARPLGDRIALIPAAVEALAAAGVAAVAKTYFPVTSGAPAELEFAVRSALAAGTAPVDRARLGRGDPVVVAPQVDGLILAIDGRDYPSTQALKFKPTPTLDALARRVPASALGRAPHIPEPGMTLYLLFVGAQRHVARALGMTGGPAYAELFGDDMAGREYRPMLFTPPGAPAAFLLQHPAGGPDLDGQVVELAGVPDGVGARWTVVLVREDRAEDVRAGGYFGNDVRTGYAVWSSIAHPLRAERLWLGPESQYFRGTKSAAYRAQTAAVNELKSFAMRTYLAGRDAVVDLGGGRGGDLGRYVDVAHLVLVEPDPGAVAEYEARVLDLADGRGRGRRRPATSMRVDVLVAAGGDDPAPILAGLADLGVPPGHADGFVCNLAVHYMLDSSERARNFAALVAGALRPGGVAVLTVMLGDAVHAKLAGVGVGEAWQLREAPAPGVDPVVKFSIRRLYRADALTATGQQIGVLHPFSGGEHYPESVTNVDALVAALAAHGVVLTHRHGVLDVVSARTADALSAADREYAALYGALVFERAGDAPAPTAGGAGAVAAHSGVVRGALLRAAVPDLREHLRPRPLSGLSLYVGRDDPGIPFADRAPEDRAVFAHGQLKLDCVEKEFLAQTRAMAGGCLVVYAGAAPGVHTPGLIGALNCEFALYDPRPFDPKLARLAGPNVRIYQSYFDAGALEREIAAAGARPIVFICDIRTGERCSDVRADMAEQLVWVRRLAATEAPKCPTPELLATPFALLKHRLPWDDGVTPYLPGRTLWQPYARQTSTETRLVVSVAGAGAALVPYDNRRYEQQCAYRNLVWRSQQFEVPACAVPGLDACADCAALWVITRRWLDALGLPSTDAHVCLEVAAAVRTAGGGKRTLLDWATPQAPTRLRKNSKGSQGSQGRQGRSKGSKGRSKGRSKDRRGSGKGSKGRQAAAKPKTKAAAKPKTKAAAKPKTKAAAKPKASPQP